MIIGKQANAKLRKMNWEKKIASINFTPLHLIRRVDRLKQLYLYGGSEDHVRTAVSILAFPCHIAANQKGALLSERQKENIRKEVFCIFVSMRFKRSLVLINRRLVRLGALRANRRNSLPSCF